MDFVYETAFPSDREPTGAAILEFVERVFTRKRTEFEAKGGLKIRLPRRRFAADECPISLEHRLEAHAIPITRLTPGAAISGVPVKEQMASIREIMEQWGNEPLRHQFGAQHLDRDELGLQRPAHECIYRAEPDAANLLGLFNEYIGEDGPSAYNYVPAWDAFEIPDAARHPVFTNVEQLITQHLVGVLGKMPNPAYAYRTAYGFMAPPGTSFFPLHREEEYVYSSNVNIWGSDKVWMFVPQAAEKDLLLLARELFGDRFPKCGNPFGHFQFRISPRLLRNRGIHVSFAIQSPGDLILTHGFHQGVNLGAGVALAGYFGHTSFFGPLAGLDEDQVAMTRDRCEGEKDYFLNLESRNFLRMKWEEWRKLEEKRARDRKGRGPESHWKPEDSIRKADLAKKRQLEAKANLPILPNPGTNQLPGPSYNWRQQQRQRQRQKAGVEERIKVEDLFSDED